jgi:hypothetical protein
MCARTVPLHVAADGTPPAYVDHRLFTERMSNMSLKFVSEMDDEIDEIVVTKVCCNALNGQPIYGCVAEIAQLHRVTHRNTSPFISIDALFETIHTGCPLAARCKTIFTLEILDHFLKFIIKIGFRNVPKHRRLWHWEI